MALKIPKNLKQYGNLLLKGGLIEVAPGIAGGMLVELLKEKEVDIKKASNWVQNNTSLWDTLKPDHQAMLKDLANRAGNIDWLDADWVISSLKGDLPAVASLFLGWKKANNWLKRQVEIIRKEVQNANNNST